MGQARRWTGAGSAILVLLMAGCAEPPASSAASVGATVFDLEDISAQVKSINELLGRPSDAADVMTTRSVVNNNVNCELIEQAAAEAGVTVAQSEVDARLAGVAEFAGGEALMQQQAAQEGVAPEMVETVIRGSLLGVELLEQLAPGASPTNDQLEQVLFPELGRLSTEIGVTINPRFGVWQPDRLVIVPDEDAPSQPAPTAELGTFGLQ